MKYLNLLMIAVLVIIGCGTTKKSSTNNVNPSSEIGNSNNFQNRPKKIPKSVSWLFQDMIPIKQGVFVMGKSNQNVFTPDDSLLILSLYPRRVFVNGFYISDHEVTNAEYREFIYWVRDSICLQIIASSDESYYKDIKSKTLNWSKRNLIFSSENIEFLYPVFLPKNEMYYRENIIDTKKLKYSYYTNGNQNSINVYPDTLCLLSGGLYAFTEPIYNLYFSNKKFDNYPVVGVSWEQAVAYCIWRTQQANQAEFYSDSGKALKAVFRLPTEAEWEYAAIGTTEQTKRSNTPVFYAFPCKENSLFDKNGNYRANFGAIYDRNGYLLKSSMDFSCDKKGNSRGYLFTSPVKSFSPNHNKLFDMAGNVAEWTSDEAKFENIFPIDISDAYQDDLFFEKMILNNLVSIDSKDAKEAKNKKMNDLFVEPDDDMKTALKKIIERKIIMDGLEKSDSVLQNYRIRYEQSAKNELHDVMIINLNKNSRIVKGGSWQTGIVYQQSAYKEIYAENKSRNTIGFRVALEFIDK